MLLSRNATQPVLVVAVTSWLLAACDVFEPPLVGSSDDASSVDSGAVDDCPGDIKVNEVDGATTGAGADREFIEIVNASAVAQNIGGLHIARQRGTGPDAGKAVAIPDGFVLQPGAFLYLVADVLDAGDGFQNSGCIDGAPTPCLQATWQIDATGDAAYILNRDKTAILCEFEYPGSTPPGDSWGRIPDGSTTLEATRPTPGAANSSR